MSFSTFSGPVRSGTVRWTTGTTPGTVVNTGLMLLAQDIIVPASALSAAGDAYIAAMLPAQSQIYNIVIDTINAFTFTGGAAPTISVELGSTNAGTEFVAPVDVTAAGRIVASSSALVNWANVNASTPGSETDVPVYLSTVIAGAPTAIASGDLLITIVYMQKGPYGNQHPLSS
jgi:hypothetical protein